MQLKIECLVFLFLLFKSTSLRPSDLTNEWIVWNVGQGQWVTHVQNDFCRHYDVGGEIGSFRKSQKNLQKLCLDRPNQIAISHWDFDHYSQIFLLVKSIPNLCWLSKPKWIEKKSVRKVEALNIPDCSNQRKNFWRPQKYRSLNDSSGVFRDERFLIPGDSPMQQEMTWIHELQGLNEVRVLVLGHHGSHTSTSEQLLQALPQIKMAISSARFMKYHHPHFLTLNRLKRFQIPTLRTEDWGHLHFSY